MTINQSAIGTTNQTAESQTGIRIFKNAQFGQIRTALGASGEPLFCLVDVCKVLGLTQPSRVKSTLRQDGVITIKGVSLTTNQFGKTSEQEVMLNFITEPNLYKCIFQSRKKEAEQFQDWVCEEVLPSIRKSGGYMVARVDETPEQIMARALLLAQDTITRQKERADMAERKAVLLQSQNEAQSKMLDAKDTTIQFLRPGATFAKAVQTSDTSCLIGDLARIIKQNGIEIGQNRLFEWLRKKSYLISRKGESYNLPTQSALNLGLFEIKKTIITKPNGNSLVTTTPKVTGKGQVYFVNKFLYDSINEAELERQRAEQSEKGGAQ